MPFIQTPYISSTGEVAWFKCDDNNANPIVKDSGNSNMNTVFTVSNSGKKFLIFYH